MRFLAGLLPFIALTSAAAANPDAGCTTQAFQSPEEGIAACRSKLQKEDQDPLGFVQRLSRLAALMREAGEPIESIKAALGSFLVRENEQQRLDTQATILWQIGEQEAAKAHAEQTVRKFPKSANSWSLLGIIAIKEEDPETALRSFYKALQADPDHLSTLKILFEKGGQYTRAIGDVNRALNLAPDDPKLYFLRARLLMRRGRPESDDLARAQDDLGTALRYEPKNAEILNMRGLVILRRGNHPDAYRHFEDAIEIDPDHPSYRVNIVFALLRFAEAGRRLGKRIGDPAEAAVEHARVAVKLRPDGATFDALASALLQSRDRAEAQVAFGKAAELGERQAERYHRNLADGGFYKGEAEDDWSEASVDALKACLQAGCNPNLRPKKPKDRAA